jgi:hypothetical protein
LSKCAKVLGTVFINNPLEVTMADARGFFCAKSWRSSCVSPFLLYAALPDLFPRAIFLLRFNKSLALHVARLALLMTTHGMQTTQPSSSGSGFLSARCTNCSPSSHPCTRKRASRLPDLFLEHSPRRQRNLNPNRSFSHN